MTARCWQRLSEAGRRWANPRERRGFTLLEVLLAIGLILLVSAALFVFYRHSLEMRARTQADHEEAQLARAIMTRVKSDLESISALTGIIRERMVQRGFAIEGQADEVTPEAGVIGSHDAIGMQSARFIPLSQFADLKISEGGTVGQSGRPPLYDVQEVHWYWSYDPETGKSFGLFRSVRPAVLPAEKISPSGDDVEQQARSGLPDSLLAGGQSLPAVLPTGPGLPPEEPEPADPLVTIEPVAPEVQWIHLRYYDGSVWTDSYNSGGSGPSPVAVEITVGFSPLLTQEMLDSGETMEKRLGELFGEEAELPLPPRTYQTTIYLPSAEMSSGGGGVRMQR